MESMKINGEFIGTVHKVENGYKACFSKTMKKQIWPKKWQAVDWLKAQHEDWNS